MFIDAMGLILGDNKKITLGELSKPRALSAIPFGGRYRIIDYMLSNMVNSGIKNIGIHTYTKYKSLMDHLGTGSYWDLDRKNSGGLHILPPYVNSEATSVQGDEEMAGLLDFVRSSKASYVIMAASNVILNTTFTDFVEDFKASGADISVMYNRDGTKFGGPNYILEVDRRGWVKDMLFNPEKSSFTKSSMGIIVMRRELLIDLIAEMMARGTNHVGIHSFVKKYDTLRVHAYEYKGLVLRINNVQSYFNSSMMLLNNQIRAELFWNGMPIFTKVKDEAPTLYSDDCKVTDAIVSDGCRISGTVTESILFRGVAVSKNCTIKNCVIMQDVHISDNCYLENVILDKNSVVRPGIKLVGHKDYPVVIGKGAIV